MYKASPAAASPGVGSSAAGGQKAGNLLVAHGRGRPRETLFQGHALADHRPGAAAADQQRRGQGPLSYRLASDAVLRSSPR